MNNARRRIVVQKYNNRPPFDMKSKEMSTVGKNYKKSYEHIEKSFRTIMNHLDAIQTDEELIEEPETKSLINNMQNITKPKIFSNTVPKILESFQKATPKRQPMVLRNNTRRIIGRTETKVKKAPRIVKSNESIKFDLQTLYRNKNIDFGKNVPNHHMMRNLLQNYDEPMEEYHTVTKKSCLKKQSIQRLDKATSTSGMPPQKPPKKPSYKLKTSQKSKSRLSTQKQSIGLMSKPCASHTSTKDHFLTSDKIISSPSYVCSICSSSLVLEDERRNGKSNGNYESSPVKKSNNNESYNKYNKSFVKKSDNKLNIKFVKNNFRLQKLKSRSKIKTVASRNYSGMLNTVKKKFPKLEINNELSTDNKYDWSDEQPEPEITTEVKFPKETRCAMERMMENSKMPDCMRIPLNKYMKPKEFSIQPAISFHHRDICTTKMSDGRKPAPYTVCSKLEPVKDSKENCGIRDHIGRNVNSGKGIPCGRPGSRVIRKVQKPRGVR